MYLIAFENIEIKKKITDKFNENLVRAKLLPPLTVDKITLILKNKLNRIKALKKFWILLKFC